MEKDISETLPVTEPTPPPAAKCLKCGENLGTTRYWKWNGKKTIGPFCKKHQKE